MKIEMNYLEMINPICRECQGKCKQFASVEIIECPNYHKRERKKYEKKEKSGTGAPA